ncbi:TniQ family protein [Aliiroseovarius sp. 2305UL8-7]|uniref:TniQ family protein n=1 Tax=Aliiroseovarius conchicola TaxID=3121637 RepID=UPI003527BE30
MTARLGLVVALGERELPIMYMGRLAILNGFVSAREFAVALGIHFDKFVRSDPPQVSQLSSLAGLDMSSMVRTMFKKLENGIVSFRNEEFHRRELRASHLKVCPDCISEQLDERPIWEIEGNAYWYLSFVRTCPKHKILLVSVHQTKSVYGAYDFSRRALDSDLFSNVHELPRIHVPSALQEYISARLDGCKIHPKLQKLGLFGLSRFCEELGRCMLADGDGQLPHLSEQELIHAADRAFSLVLSGHAAIDEVYDGMIAKSRDKNMRVAFAGLLPLMAATGGDQIAPLRQHLHDKIVENYPVEKGRIIAGLEVQRRRIHTLGSACAAYKMKPFVLKQALQIAGHISDRTIASQILIDDDAVRDHLHEYRSAIPHAEALRRYGIPTQHFAVLRRAGFISDLYPDAPGAPIYRPSDLEEFFGALLRSRKRVLPGATEFSTIPKATNRAFCKVAEIIRLLLDQKIPVYSTTGSLKFSDIRVNHRDVLAALSDQNSEVVGLSLRQVRQNLGVCDSSMSALISLGYLRGCRTMTPEFRRTSTFVTQESLDEFVAKFISARDLARDLKISPQRLSFLLRDLSHLVMKLPEPARGRFVLREGLEEVYMRAAAGSGSAE